MTDALLRQVLVTENDEYRKLVERHRGYEVRLIELINKPRLSPAEDLERINLKKYKLRVKDRMEAIARSYRSSYA